MHGFVIRNLHYFNQMLLNDLQYYTSHNQERGMLTVVNNYKICTFIYHAPPLLKSTVDFMARFFIFLISTVVLMTVKKYATFLALFVLPNTSSDPSIFCFLFCHNIKESDKFQI